MLSSEDISALIFYHADEIAEFVQKNCKCATMMHEGQSVPTHTYFFAALLFYPHLKCFFSIFFLPPTLYPDFIATTWLSGSMDLQIIWQRVVNCVCAHSRRYIVYIFCLHVSVWLPEWWFDLRAFFFLRLSLYHIPHSSYISPWLFPLWSDFSLSAEQMKAEWGC